jgi:hypothetical protein
MSSPFDDSLESDDPSFALTVRDRLPYSYILTKQVQSFQASYMNKEFSRREVEESIKGLVAMIPEPWVATDPDWLKDMEEAKTTITIDVRPSFAGVKMKKEIAEKRGIAITQEVEVVDYFKMLHAVFNKLNRLGMITRKQWTEAPTGMPKGETALPEGMNLQEYLASLEEEEGEEENADST